MSKFDDKLTLLTKQFHFMPPGLISDILNQVGCDVQEAQNIISAMIPDQNEEKPIEDDGQYICSFFFNSYSKYKIIYYS